MLNEFFEHVPAVPPRLVTDVPRLDPSWFDKFAQHRTPDIADHVGLLYTMDPGIKPLYHPMKAVVGQALTVKPWPGDGLAVYGAVGLAQEGDVLVVGGRGELDISRGGFHVFAVPRQSGVRGAVLDCAIRDVVEFEEVGFPVYGRAGTPHASSKRHAGEINVPVSCGGVIVEAGDLVVADSEGVVVVPRAYIEKVWEAVSSTVELSTDDAAQTQKHGERVGRHREVFDATGGVSAPWTP